MALLSRRFRGAQVFYVDPASVSGSSRAAISRIDLYFKNKPDLNFNVGNVSNPGVRLFIAETIYDVPRITRDSGLFTGQVSSVPLADVLTSSDATVPTTFRFIKPIEVETDKNYCFVLMYDQQSQFTLWTSKQGEILVGTTAISPGPSNKFIGKYYETLTAFVAEDDTNLDEYVKNWRPVTDTSLKFAVYVARYAHDGVPVGANGSISNNDIIRTNTTAEVTSNTSGYNFNVNFGSYEFLAFDENKSTKAAFVGGLMAYQNTVPYPGGPSYVSITTTQGNTTITANTQLPNGSNFQWGNIFPATNQYNRVVIRSSDESKVNIRTVTAVVSNTVLTVNEPLTFSNTAARLLVTPTGRISSFNKDAPFGVADAFVMLHESSANSTVRFVNNSVSAVQVTSGGSGYNNADIFYLNGYEEVAGKVEGGYSAIGNVVTNGTGVITAIQISNLGAGFVNSSNFEVVVANGTSGNTTGNTTGGSGATFSYTIDSVLKTEYGPNNFRGLKVQNLDIGEFIPYSNVTIPDGTEYQLRLETNYYVENDTTTFDGKAVYVNPNASNNRIQMTLYDLNSTEPLGTTPVIPSKSNEFTLKYANGALNDKVSNSATPSSTSLRIITDIQANNDYMTVGMKRPSIQFSKYIINNDATNEHTDSGNAYAKGISKTINFARTAEDLRVYLTAYKPANTDIKAYARIMKNEDPDAFDDKNWTELELKDGTDVVSSLADPLDYVELTYGFYDIPADRTALTGVVEVQSADANVIGFGTLFSSELAAGDLVYAYQPLFPDNYFVAAVQSVTNNTLLTLDFSTTNASIIAEGMKLEKITKPQQAFNNIQNDNIVRYYNGTTSKFDGYENLALKLVFLSDSPHKIPRIDDMRGVGVSA